jgi:peptide/nickel transport system permease protein
VRFLLQRLMFYAIAFWAALTLNFLLPRLAGGSPASGIIQSDPNTYRTCEPCLRALIAQYGSLNGHESFSHMLNAYPHYLWSMLQGDLGKSTRYAGTPVTDIIRQTLPYSILIAGASLAIAFVLGSFLGMVCAWKRGGVLDNVLPSLLAFIGAFPSFFLALLAIYFLGLGQGPFHLKWFPTSLAYDNTVSPEYSWTFIGSVLRHAELPILVLVLVGTGGWLLGMRNVMINNVAEDYITMARAKGLRDWRIMTTYAGRNSILPNFTGFAIGLGFVVTGTILVEFVFSFPGMGLALQNAATGADYPTTQGILLILTVCVLLANFIMDSIYVILDPRTRAA